KVLSSVTDMTTWVQGTADQITSTNALGAVILSFPSAVTLPGSLAITTTLDVTEAATLSSTLTVADDITASSLTASRLVFADASKVLSSVADMTTWVQGTAGQITSTNSSGAAVLSFPSAVTFPGSLAIATTLTVADSITASSLSASRLVFADASKVLSSVADMTTWVQG